MENFGAYLFAAVICLGLVAALPVAYYSERNAERRDAEDKD